MTVELDFICDTCGRPVEDGEGGLYVCLAEIRDRRVDVPALLAIPWPVPWHIRHSRCSPAEIAGGVYRVCVEQVRTWRQLLGWTAHLMEKTWLPATTWGALVGEAAEGRSRRIAEHARDDAA